MNLRRFLKRSGIAMLIMLPLIVLWIVWRMPSLIPESPQKAMLDVGSPISSLAITADSSLVAIAHGTGTVTLWRPDNTSQLAQWQVSTTRIDALTLLENGAILLIGDLNGNVALWDVAQQTKLFDVPTSFRVGKLSYSENVSNFGLCLNQNRAVIGSWDGRLAVFDTQSGQLLNDNLRTWSQTAPIQATACSETNTMLAFGIETGKIVLWNMATQQIEKQLDSVTGVAKAITFFADDQMLAVAYQDGTIVYWLLPEGTQTGQGFRTWQLGAAIFDPTGRFLAYGGYQGLSVALPIFNTPLDPQVYLAEATTGTQCVALRGHRDLITSLAWSFDSTLLVSGSKDGTVRLWDVSGCQ